MKDVPKKGAVVLLSGGLDSATVLALALRDGFTPLALSFAYGQRHAYELRQAQRLAQQSGVEHVVIELPVEVFQGSALLVGGAHPPFGRSLREIAQGGIPATYVPARNALFLAYALALAESRQAFHIFIGVNHIDYGGYPDCRPEFLDAWQRMANLATKAGVESVGAPAIVVHAPLLSMSKGEIIRTGLGLGVDYALTFSCYAPMTGHRPCGRCDSCLLRAQGFAEAGIRDPLNRARLPA